MIGTNLYYFKYPVLAKCDLLFAQDRSDWKPPWAITPIFFTLPGLHLNYQISNDQYNSGVTLSELNLVSLWLEHMCSPSLIPTCSTTIDGSLLETQASAQEDGVLSRTVLVPICILCASLAMTQFRHIIIDSTATSLQDFSYCRGSLLETHLVGSGHSTLLSRLHEIQGITLPSYKTYPTCSLKVDHRKNSLQHCSHMIVSPTGYSPQKMSYGLKGGQNSNVTF